MTIDKNVWSAYFTIRRRVNEPSYQFRRATSTNEIVDANAKHQLQV